MKVAIRKSAVKDFKKISEQNTNQSHEKIATLEDFPDLGNIKKLINFTPSYRLRVGNYRVLFDVIST